MACMRKMTMALVLVLAGISTAQAASYSVTGGSLAFTGTPTGNAAAVGVAGLSGMKFNLAGGGTFKTGVYQDGIANPADYIFPYFTLSTAHYFDMVTDSTFGGSVPSINWGSMTADMSSFMAIFSKEYNQGSSSASVASLGGSNYSISWYADFLNSDSTAELNGYTGHWVMNISGGPTPVPVPASLWLLGSGLVGLAGVVRRKLAA